jgi:hypothetical protein
VKSSIDLHIQELILHGVAPADRYTIAEAVERELARLLDGQGVASSLQSAKVTEEIRGPTFNARSDAKSPAIGQQIAQAIYQGFSR